MSLLSLPGALRNPPAPLLEIGALPLVSIVAIEDVSVVGLVDEGASKLRVGDSLRRREERYELRVTSCARIDLSR